MSIRLAAIDIDGTLITSSQEILPRVEYAVTAAIEHGVDVALCTGRSISECKYILQTFPQIRYVIACSGAEVLDLRTNEFLYKRSFSSAEAYQIYQKLLCFDCLISASANGFVYNCQHQMQNFGHYVPAELLTELHEIYTHGHLFVDDLGDLIAHHSTYVEQFYLLFPDCTERHRALSFFSKLPYFVTTAGYTDMEITHLQATKGMALATLAKHLGLRRENVIALGDSKNDLSALEYAGIAVVMENGSDDLKRAADIIAPSNEIGGVADILEMIIHGVL